VRQHPDPTRHAVPGARGRAELRGDEVTHVVGQHGQRSLQFERSERARVLREEQVRRARVTLLEDGRRQFRGVAVADLQLDVGGLLEVGEHLSHQFFAPTRVDRERAFEFVEDRTVVGNLVLRDHVTGRRVLATVVGRVRRDVTVRTSRRQQRRGGGDREEAGERGSMEEHVRTPGWRAWRRIG